ncbi:hypothetical protein [Kitasatospora griseola]|uniref:hypothetical protein n=1 Tax=Kitasatospora griseola TaxID=2064 RepID=UPI003662546C
MDELEQLAQAAAPVVTRVMVTEGWALARSGLIALWRRFHPGQGESIGEELDDSRDELTAAREAGDESAVAGLQNEWERRLARLLRRDANAAPELRQLLDELRAALPADDAPTPGVTLNARASGHAKIYQAGRDMTITDR